jgi:hypothetical protein
VIKPWGEVFVDDKPRGIVTATRQLVLPEGTYRIEIRNPSGPSFNTEIEVAAGKTVTIEHKFE